MRKVLFFDIDGTLVNFQGKMPDSAKSAIKQAKKNGHMLVICSGRSVRQIYPWLMEVGFDGIIAASGAYVEYGGQVIYEHAMDADTLQTACALLEEAGAAYSAQTKNGIIVTEDSERRLNGKFAAMNEDGEIIDRVFHNMQVDERLSQRADIEKLNFFESRINLAEIQKRLSECCEVTAMSFENPEEDAGEISSKGIHKALGIQKYIEHVGMIREDTIAFGDGPNDFDMIEYAGVGVAMGNALSSLKEKADYVTTGINEDGIEHALRDLGLI